MCENIICYLKLHSFLITNISLLLILGFSLLLYFKKMGEIHREWTFSKKLLNFFEGKVFILYFILLIISVLAAFNSVILNTKDLIPRDKIAESYGLIFSAIITVSGVFAGFVFNKRQTYKEIVTKERIVWLNNLKNNFSEYLALTNYGYVPSKDIDRVRELYNKIIFNINSVNDIEALNAIKIYNDYVFATRHEDSREIRKYSIKINSADKEENFSCSVYVSDYKFLKNNMEEKFRAIFKGTWTFIKGEAD